MEHQLRLHCVDLLQTGPAGHGALEVLPRGENRLQKVAAGDLHGVVQVFSIKRGVVVLSFKTPPCPHKVTSLVTGRGAKQLDKLFVAAGNTVRGLTKKGREFFRLNTTLTAPPDALCVADGHVWAAVGSLLCHYTEAGQQDSYMAPDAITAIELLAHSSGWLPVLACRDSHVRVLGRDGLLLFEIATPSPPTALRYVTDVHGPAGAGGAAQELLYGCEDGRLVQLLVEGGAVRQGFIIPDGRGSSSAQVGSSMPSGMVTTIYCGADYSKSGVADIVIGHEDGSVEVWAVDAAGVPRLAAAVHLPESIAALSGGHVTSASSPDIIVHTGLTGRVIALATDPAAFTLGAVQSNTVSAAGALGTLSSFNRAAQHAREAAAGGAAGHQTDVLAMLNTRIARETQELSELHARIARERERCVVPGQAGGSSVAPLVDVRHSLTLQAQDGCHMLSVEAAVSLFALALHATVHLDLLDLPASVAIVSRSQSEPTACGSGSCPGASPTFATYRCQDSTNRLSVRFRARETAEGGKVTAFIVPTAPDRNCPVLEAALAPLCLHQPITAGSVGAAEGEEPIEWLRRCRPVSEVVLTGSFSIAEAHTWLRAVLPGLPAAPASSAGGTTLHRHVRLGSLLGSSYSAGRAVLVAEHASTLATAHDALLAAATAAGARVGARLTLGCDALNHGMRLLWPAFEVAAREARRRRLWTALQELREQDGVENWLAPDYVALLADAAPSGPGGHAGSAAGQCDQHGQRAAHGDGDEVGAIYQLAVDHARLLTGGVPSTRALAALKSGLATALASPPTVDKAVELLLGALMIK